MMHYNVTSMFATVYLVKKIKGGDFGRLFAMKVMIKRDLLVKNNKNVERLMRERRVGPNSAS